MRCCAGGYSAMGVCGTEYQQFTQLRVVVEGVQGLCKGFASNTQPNQLQTTAWGCVRQTLCVHMFQECVCLLECVEFARACVSRRCLCVVVVVGSVLLLTLDWRVCSVLLHFPVECLLVCCPAALPSLACWLGPVLRHARSRDAALLGCMQAR